MAVLNLGGCGWVRNAVHLDFHVFKYNPVIIGEGVNGFWKTKPTTNSLAYLCGFTTLVCTSQHLSANKNKN